MNFKGLLFSLLLINSSLYAQEALNLELISKTDLNGIANDIWGYVAPDGTEYAIAGTRKNTQIFDISNPSAPKLVYTAPGGGSSVWRDYKSYGNYIYGTADEGEEGVTIIDMNNAPDGITHKLWTDTFSIGGNKQRINTCHNLYIDDRGRMFLAGCNVSKQGVIIYDVTKTPLEPQLLGIEDVAYSHDVINVGDTMYSSEIYNGDIAAYDISDMKNIKLLAKKQTSSVFTHNAWPSDDGKYLFTTDEVGNGNLDAYDISDLDNIKRLDTYRPKNDSKVLPHNAHYHNGFLVTSWYIEGLVVVDGSRPHNLIRVGQYDTNPQNKTGCWGAYPYLPSGLIIATDMENGLFVFKPNYVRASYVEGKISSASDGSPINAATIRLITDTIATDMSNATGDYATGAPYTGDAVVVVSHPDYFSDTIQVTLAAGEVSEVNVQLKVAKSYSLTGTVQDEDGSPIAGAHVLVSSKKATRAQTTNDQGAYSTSLVPGDYEVSAAKWGYKHAAQTISVNSSVTQPLKMSKGYQDDFFADLGWTVESTASQGIWTRAIPKITTSEGKTSNPGNDVTDDIGGYCYVTGNDPKSPTADDVHNGTTVLTSPIIDLSDYDRAKISLAYWFFSDIDGIGETDTMTISLVTDSGRVRVGVITKSASEWRRYSFVVGDYTKEKKVRLSVSIGDDDFGYIMEAGIDAFLVSDAGGTTSVGDVTVDKTLKIYPNPASDVIHIVPQSSARIQTTMLYDMLGQKLLSSSENKIDISNAPSGVYMLVVRMDNGTIKTKEVIKVK